MENSLELIGVTKEFWIESQKVVALRGVDLSVPKGTQAAIIGRSGAGKSTLLHIAGTLDDPTSGIIKINGIDVSSIDDKDKSRFRNRTVGFIFQMNNLLTEFTAIENIMLPGLIAGIQQEAVTDRAYEVLKQVDLSHRAKHRPGELSGGEQQRVAIARALLMSPTLLLADEPTGNLDRMTSGIIQDLLYSLCEQHGMTMLLVTHDLELAKTIPHQIVVEDGQIIDRGDL